MWRAVWAAVCGFFKLWHVEVKSRTFGMVPQPEKWCSLAKDARESMRDGKDHTGHSKRSILSYLSANVSNFDGLLTCCVLCAVADPWRRVRVAGAILCLIFTVTAYVAPAATIFLKGDQVTSAVVFTVARALEKISPPCSVHCSSASGPSTDAAAPAECYVEWHKRKTTHTPRCAYYEHPPAVYSSMVRASTLVKVAIPHDGHRLRLSASKQVQGETPPPPSNQHSSNDGNTSTSPYGPNTSPASPQGPGNTPTSPYGPNTSPAPPQGPGNAPTTAHGPNTSPAPPQGISDPTPSADAPNQQDEDKAITGSVHGSLPLAVVAVLTSVVNAWTFGALSWCNTQIQHWDEGKGPYLGMFVAVCLWHVLLLCGYVLAIVLAYPVILGLMGCKAASKAWQKCWQRWQRWRGNAGNAPGDVPLQDIA